MTTETPKFEFTVNATVRGQSNSMAFLKLISKKLEKLSVAHGYTLTYDFYEADFFESLAGIQSSLNIQVEGHADTMAMAETKVENTRKFIHSLAENFRFTVESKGFILDYSNEPEEDEQVTDWEQLGEHLGSLLYQFIKKV